MITAITTRMAERRNGIRQPHAVNSSGDIDERVTKITTSASSSPSVAVVWIHEVFPPRFWSVLCSAT